LTPKCLHDSLSVEVILGVSVAGESSRAKSDGRTNFGSAPVGGADHHLTPREAEVYILALEGRSVKEIASALEVSSRTVKYHLAGIFRKTGVSSRLELLAGARSTQQ
jgi:DNA-binding CsgD family transcriptional regulator